VREMKQELDHTDDCLAQHVAGELDCICGAYEDQRVRVVVDELVVREIARELYDRFVMGGWEPEDAYPQIRKWLAGVCGERK
jgi:hypothetical protein